ncbi:MAG: endoglucanase [Myxococcaceae bacterium]|nr:endoglucanase [Myxococcaceae bacterium]
MTKSIFHSFVLITLACTACTGDIVDQAEPTATESRDESASPDSGSTAATSSADAGAPTAQALATAGKTEAVSAPVAADKTASSRTAATTIPSSTTTQRPDYNHGQGFFVRDGKLYDANGNEFRIRGVNKVHWDAETAGLLNVRPSLTRWAVDFTQSSSANLALLQGKAGNGGTIAEGSVVMPGNWNGTCKDDPALLTEIVDTWVAQASAWTQLEKYMILNIANEWGPGGGEQWRDSYIAAVKRLRDAGYHATLSVTAPACGQDPNAIVKYGQAIYDSDPEKNVIFDQHLYGEYQDARGGAPGKFDDMPDLEAHIAGLAKSGLVVILGEFGPGRDVGPSPTNINPQRVMKFAEQYGLGWLAWAWDDNNLAQSLSDDNGFSMSIRGSYQTSADLTEFGRQVVEDSVLGLKVLAKRASIFD